MKNQEEQKQNGQTVQGIEKAPSVNDLMMKMDDVSFAILANIRTIGRPDTNPVLIRENTKWLNSLVKELIPMLDEIEKHYESF